MCVGPSGSGKTFFTTELVTKNLHLFKRRPKAIYFCYSIWQPSYNTMKKNGVKFYQGIPDTKLLPKWFPKGGLLIMDDLMEEAGNDKRVLDLFTKESHHRDITVMYLTQDMFPPGKFAKSISRNAHYVITFKNPRDNVGLRNLLTQAFPMRWKEVLTTYQRITQRPYGYMVLDFHPSSSDNVRVVSHLLNSEGPNRCYQFKQNVEK